VERLIGRTVAVRVRVGDGVERVVVVEGRGLRGGGVEAAGGRVERLGGRNVEILVRVDGEVIRLVDRTGVEAVRDTDDVERLGGRTVTTRGGIERRGGLGVVVRVTDGVVRLGGRMGAEVDRDLDETVRLGGRTGAEVDRGLDEIVRLDGRIEIVRVRDGIDGPDRQVGGNVICRMVGPDGVWMRVLGYPGPLGPG
jgi:hypothetical protein